MKTKIIYSIPGLMILSIAVVLTCCNTPSETEETIETSAAVIDTVGTKSATPGKTKSAVPLTLIIKNLASATAPVMIGVYKSKKNFLKLEGRLKEYKFIPTGNVLTALITDLSYGEFAMAIYQDVNSNGKIDKNFIGVPTEGYAFSNNYKPKIKAPAFEDCSFTYDSSTNTITMTMIQ